MTKKGISALLFCAVAWLLGAQNTSLPLNPIMYRPLEDSYDDNLTCKLQDVIKEHPYWSNLTKNKKMCVGLVDMSDPLAPRFASVNGDHMMYAASLPKIAILLAVVDAIDKGQVKLSKEVDQMLSSMIRVSSNTSSTALIDLVGYDKISSTLQDKKYKLYDKSEGGGLWVGKRYAAGGKRNPDPMKGLSHAATADQVCKYYYMMAYGKLISPERSEQMLGYLKDPQLHHKFVNTLERLEPGATFYRKSGTWQNFHADSIMVVGKKWRNYILVALVDDHQGESIMRELAGEVDQLLYNQNHILSAK